MHIVKEDLLPNCSFKVSRSGGKGGQHVNKVSTKAEVNYDLMASALFSADQKARILAKLGARLNAHGLIQVVSDAERSQLKNKEHAVDKLLALLEKALYVKPARKATKVPRRVTEARLEDKRRRAMRKIDRRGEGSTQRRRGAE